jgi:hypothetical protein
MDIQLANDKTLKYVIGRFGVPDCDFNFGAAADHVQQNLDLGAIIPACCKVIDVQVVCVEAVVGVTDFTVVVGNASAGGQFVAALSCNALNEVVGFILATLLIPVIANWAAATHVWIGGDPTDNTWNLMTAGKWEIFITYRNYKTE